MLEAKCRTAPDPDAWECSKLKRDPNNPNAFRDQARALCRGCEVIPECAEFAVRTRATAVVMAGINLKHEAQNKDAYEELKRIAKTRKETQ